METERGPGQLHATRTVWLIVLALLLSGLALDAVSAAPANPAPPYLCDEGPWAMSRVRPGRFDVGPSEVVDLESDYDSANIQLALVRPDVPAAQKVPVIVVASPYVDHDLTADQVARCGYRLVDNFVQHGYAVGLVAVRGSGGSGGCNDLMGPAERADLDQAITWFGRQPWSTGAVGMIGVSYDGGAAWEVASTGNPYLKTIVPVSGVNDMFDLLFRGGVPEYRSMAMSALYYLYPFYPGDPQGRGAQSSVEAAACPALAEGEAASAYSTATGERDPLGYWAERNSRPGVEKDYKGSIFLARGLQDWNVDPAHDVPWVSELDRAGTEVKYMLGQWDHQWPDSASADEVMDPGEPVRWDWADVLLEWWNRSLKGEKTARVGAPVEVQDSSGAWRREEAWPPADARVTEYYLSPDNALVESPPPGEGSFPIVYDPTRLYRPTSGFCVCTRFTLPPVKQELRFAGFPVVSATVTPLGPGGHIAAYLYSGHSSSSELVGWGMTDLRFGSGNGTASVVVPGQPMEVQIPLQPLDVVVPSRKSLILLITQAGYGGPPTALPHRNSAWAVPMRLEVGGDKSSIRLHTFIRGPKSFFLPPRTPRPAR